MQICEVGVDCLLSAHRMASWHQRARVAVSSRWAHGDGPRSEHPHEDGPPAFGAAGRGEHAGRGREEERKEGGDNGTSMGADEVREGAGERREAGTGGASRPGGEDEMDVGAILNVGDSEMNPGDVAPALGSVAEALERQKQTLWEAVMRRVLALMSAPAALEASGFQSMLRATQALEEVGGSFTGRRGGTLHSHMCLVHQQLFAAHHSREVEALRCVAAREFWQPISGDHAVGRGHPRVRQVLERQRKGEGVFAAWGDGCGEGQRSSTMAGECECNLSIPWNRTVKQPFTAVVAALVPRRIPESAPVQSPLICAGANGTGQGRTSAKVGEEAEGGANHPLASGSDDHDHPLARKGPSPVDEAGARNSSVALPRGYPVRPTSEVPVPDFASLKAKGALFGAGTPLRSLGVSWAFDFGPQCRPAVPPPGEARSAPAPAKDALSDAMTVMTAKVERMWASYSHLCLTSHLPVAQLVDAMTQALEVALLASFSSLGDPFASQAPQADKPPPEVPTTPRLRAALARARGRIGDVRAPPPPGAQLGAGAGARAAAAQAAASPSREQSVRDGAKGGGTGGPVTEAVAAEGAAQKGSWLSRFRRQAGKKGPDREKDESVHGGAAGARVGPQATAPPLPGAGGPIDLAQRVCAVATIGRLREIAEDARGALERLCAGMDAHGSW